MLLTENIRIMKISTDTKFRSLEVTIHIVCWGLFFAFPLFIIPRSDGSIDWYAYLRHSFISFMLFFIFYLNYSLFVPYLLFKDKEKGFYFANVVAIGLMTLGLNYYNYLFTPPEMDHPMPPRIIFVIRDMSSLIFAAGLSVAIQMSKQWSRAEAERKEAIANRTEAELKNLRNQLNPHFLLNTLNNIYALIAFDADKAQQAVQELSKLLRYVLYDNQQMFVPLKKEADFMQNYVELMRIRVSSHVEIRTSFHIKPNSQTPIAPLIFISLVENAFKHGISPIEPSFIDIELSETDDAITCRIENSNHPKTAADKSGSGIGLAQVSKRLELVYPGKYKWEHSLTNDEKEYHSSITIYLNS